MNYETILHAVQADERYLRNLDWGKPRHGHPESTLRAHIEELESNLNRLTHKLPPDAPAKLRLLIHVHDICKPHADRGVAITDPRSHASLGRAFLAEF